MSATPVMKIVKTLRLIQFDERIDLHARATAEMAADEIERLLVEVADWKCRWEAERQASIETEKAYDNMLNSDWR